MRWRIIGADKQTGQDRDLIVEAPLESQAVTLVSKAMLIESIKPMPSALVSSASAAASGIAVVASGLNIRRMAVTSAIAAIAVGVVIWSVERRSLNDAAVSTRANVTPSRDANSIVEVDSPSPPPQSSPLRLLPSDAAIALSRRDGNIVGPEDYDRYLTRILGVYGGDRTVRAAQIVKAQEMFSAKGHYGTCLQIMRDILDAVESTPSLQKWTFEDTLAVGVVTDGTRFDRER